MRDTGWAKINLALHVRRRRDDGYHEIETIFAFVDAGDVVELVEGDEGLSIDGPFAAEIVSDSSNLILKAAEAYQSTFQRQLESSWGFRLSKVLPVSAGLGGGSADAAATLRLLARRDNVSLGDQRLFEIAAGLGADVPACIASMICKGEGVGEVLTPIDMPEILGTGILLVNPRKPCPTGAVFNGWDQVDRGPLGSDFVAGRNDLTASAISQVPEIAQILATLSDMPGANLVRMSGSGATCFALFDTDDALSEAEARLKGYYPNWWTMAGHLR